MNRLIKRIKRKTSNAISDIVSLCLSIVNAMVLASIIIVPIYAITGYLVIPSIVLLIACWYLDTAQDNNSFNPLKWLVKIFGVRVNLDDVYYTDNHDAIVEWLADNYSYWRYTTGDYDIPTVTIYNDEILYDNKIVLRFFSMDDAVQFKLIFNKNS